MRLGASGSAEVGEALARRVNGRTIPEVLQLADQAKLERLVAVRDQLKPMVDANALLAAMPGDEELSAMLAAKRRDQAERLEKLLAEIATTRAQFVKHGGTPDAEQTVGLSPAGLSRTEALAEFDRMLSARGKLGQEQYGDWPVKFDRDGTELDPEIRADFEARKAEAAKNGHTVVAIYVRMAWRVFDAKVQMPEFSDAAVGKLTEADRRRLQDRWAMSDAEIWARKQASLDSHETAAANIKAQVKAALGDVFTPTVSQSGMRVVEPVEQPKLISPIVR